MKKIILIIIASFLVFNSTKAQSPVFVKDIYKGATGSTPTSFINYNDKIYFSALSKLDSMLPTFSDLWVSDGTELGTKKVKNLNQNNGFYLRTYKPFVFNNYLMFSGNTLISYSPELWKSDGTDSGTIPITNFTSLNGGGISSDFMSKLVQIGNSFFFSASDGNNSHGYELWKSDGTTQGTMMVKDIVIGKGNSNPYGFAKVNGKLLFFVDKSIWLSDGTESGTNLIVDNIDIQGLDPIELNSSTVLFYASKNNDGDFELWKSDGTTAGTVLVKDIFTGKTSSRYMYNPIKVMANGYVYFSADDGIHGEEIWRSDGTSNGTTILKDITPGIDRTDGVFLRSLNNNLIFSTSNSSLNHYTLWNSDGTEIGTKIIIDSLISPPINVNNNIPELNVMFFTNNYNKIYKTDGTKKGTVLIDSIQGNSSCFISEYGYSNGNLFMRAYDDLHGDELWKLNVGKLIEVGIEKIKTSQNFIVIFPNPATNELNISSILPIEKTEIYNLTGVLQSCILNKNSIDISNLNTGIYFIKVYSENGVSTQKFVKQ